MWRGKRTYVTKASIHNRKPLFAYPPFRKTMSQLGPYLSLSKRFACRYYSSVPSLPNASPHSVPFSSHDSLASFLAYARRTSLSPKSSVYIGTRYEYLCLSALTRLSFRSLTRTGGRGDRGIDLQGQWALPTLPFELPALVSCKAYKGGVGPEIIRELEGTVGRKGGVGVLVGRKEATKGVRDALRRSAVGVMWVMVEEAGSLNADSVAADAEELVGKDEQGDEQLPVARIRQILWNEKVEMMGAAGLGVGVRYFEGLSRNLEKEVCLTWRGRIWEPGVDGTRPEFASFRGLEAAKDDATISGAPNAIGQAE